MKSLFFFLWSFFKTSYYRQFRSRKNLERWQDRQVKNLIQWVLPKSSFYREHFSGYDISNWKTLPTSNKALMMEHFDRLNTAGIKKPEAFSLALKAEENRDFTSCIRGITVGLSSGTSGNRGLFLVSPKERAAWSGAFLAKILPGSLLQKHRMALFLRSNSRLYTTLNSKRMRFEYFDLLLPIEQHLERLNAFNPSLLLAPPSLLRILAENIRQGKLNINPMKVISIAEVLDPLDEQFIESQIHQKIHQIYQCTEGFLASTCKYGTLHLNEDLVVIEKEYIDQAAGKFSPIITDMNRRTQPIIRYRLNDILTESKTSCPCGSIFTALESIEGRCDDMFYGISNTDPSQFIPIFPDYIRRAIITASGDIHEYMVFQHRPDLLEVRMRVNEKKEKEGEKLIVEALKDLFGKLACITPAVEVSPWKALPKDQKLRRVRRSFVVP